MYIMIIYVLAEYMLMQLSDFNLMLNADFIVLAILSYSMRTPSLVVVLAFGIFKDLWLWDQFHGIATIQYLMVYGLLEQSKAFYAKQTFQIFWMHFTILNALYQIIPVAYFYIKTGTLIYQSAMWHMLSNVFWFPILFALLHKGPTYSNSVETINER